MEALVQEAGPPTRWFPRNLRQMVEWQDAELKLTRWVSFSVAAPNGPNGDLRRRFDIARQMLLKKRGKDSAPAGREVGHVLAINQVKVLAEQNALLMAEKHDLERRSTLLEKQLDSMYGRERELVEMLNKILPAGRKMRAISPG
jgi:hypothetical protein